MKKLMLIACFAIFWFSGVFAQKIDFSYSIDSVKINDIYQYKISVNITEGDGPLYIGLFEDMYAKGLTLIEKKEDSLLKNFTFTVISRKNYLIIVRNKNTYSIKSLKF